MKSIFQSKVLYFNLLTVIVLVANYYGYTPDPVVSEKASQTLSIVAPLINIVLRFFTNKAVSLTGK